MTGSRRIKHGACRIQTPALALHCNAEDTQTFTAGEGISAEPGAPRGCFHNSAGGLQCGLCVRAVSHRLLLGPLQLLQGG